MEYGGAAAPIEEVDAVPLKPKAITLLVLGLNFGQIVLLVSLQFAV